MELICTIIWIRYKYRLLPHICIIIFVVSLTGCDIALISLGRINHVIPSHKPLHKKPKYEIARICYAHSMFNRYKEYEILTLEKLLQQAQKRSGTSIFHNVGIWQYGWNIAYIWQKKCLVLGKIDEH